MTFSYASYPNIPYVYGNLLPGGWANFSGQTHVFTLDPDDYCFNPGMQLNGNALFQLSQVGAGGFGFNMQMPDQAVVDQMAKSILAPIANDHANQNIRSCDAVIENAKTQLQGIIDNEKTSAEDKAKAQELITKLEEQEAKLKELKENQENLTPDEAHAKSEEIKKAITDILKEAKTIGQTQEAEQAEQSEQAQDSEQAQASEQAQDSEQAQPQRERQGARLDAAREALALSDAFHDAVNYTWGTDDEKFDQVCEALNEDNITDTMNQYQKSYGVSFMEDFMWDADYSQKRDYGKKIARTLRNKAEDLGIMDQCREEFAKIFKELDSKAWVNNDIYEEFDSVIAKITKAQAQQEE